jgi:hypothetical protein
MAVLTYLPRCEQAKPAQGGADVQVLRSPSALSLLRIRMGRMEASNTPITPGQRAPFSSNADKLAGFRR